MRLFSLRLARRRDPSVLAKQLKRQGLLREARVARLRLTLVRARDARERRGGLGQARRVLSQAVTLPWS